MSDEQAPPKLDPLRAQIDSIDDQLLALLERRAQVAVDVARAKVAAGLASYYDPDRERRIVERLTHGHAGPLSSLAIRAVFREIISACLSIQQPLRVAYLGPEGTFSQLAARKLFGQAAAYWDAPTIDGVFDAVARGDVSRGVVPVENSSEGSVSATLRALLNHDLLIERELVLEVAHCLLSKAPSLTSVARVYSHPQALGQCGNWLSRNLPDVPTIPCSSTSAAVLEALADPQGAALGSQLAGELYGLPTLCENVQDNKDNATRFLVIGPRDSVPTGDDRTSLAFSLVDGPGVLRRALEAFENEGLSLTRIESHPSREKAWGYLFFVDLVGHRESPSVSAAITQLEKGCSWVKLFGSYPRHKT
ncbi:MAG: prephenate dehydratase [Polyangiaceae bacterium]